MGGMVSAVELMGAAQFRGDARREQQLPVDDVADARGHPHGVGTAFEVGRHGYAAHAVAVDDLRLAPARFHVGDLAQGHADRGTGEEMGVPDVRERAFALPGVVLEYHGAIALPDRTHRRRPTPGPCWRPRPRARDAQLRCRDGIEPHLGSPAGPRNRYAPIAVRASAACGPSGGRPRRAASRCRCRRSGIRATARSGSRAA